MRLSLADRTGVATGLICEDVAAASATAHIGNASRSRERSPRTPVTAPKVAVQTLHIPHQVDWERLPDGPVPSTASSRRLDALLSKRPDLVDAVKERKLAKCVGGRTGLPGHKSPPFTLKQYAHVIPGMQAEAAARSRP